MDESGVGSIEVTVVKINADDDESDSGAIVMKADGTNIGAVGTEAQK